MGTATTVLAVLTSLAAAAVGSGGQAGEQFTELLGFRLLQAKLADVQKRLGSVELEQSGDAGEYLATLCYVDRRVHTTVLFKSGEMGGPDHELLGFELRRYDDRTDLACRSLDSSETAVPVLQLGPLHLGMMRDAYRKYQRLVDVDGGGAMSGQHEPCMNCREPVSPAARVCPHCRTSIVVGVRIDQPVNDARARYRAARAFAQIGSEAPSFSSLH
jgi:hypothetical protein